MTLDVPYPDLSEAFQQPSGTRNNPIDLVSQPPTPVGTPGNPIDMDLWELDPVCPSVHVGETLIDIYLAEHLEAKKKYVQDPAVNTARCTTCNVEESSDSFPSLEVCQHPPHTCGTCYALWVTAQLEQTRWTDAKCPERNCQTRLDYHTIKTVVSHETFDLYDMYLTRATLSRDPDFKWCLVCQSGQLHANGEEGNIFMCAACDNKMCFVHEVKWHENETCDQYERRVSRHHEEKASLEAIEQLSKRCPGPDCGYRIEKNRGCDHMTCSQCTFEFCWICLRDYNQIRKTGNSAHESGCKYHSDMLG